MIVSATKQIGTQTTKLELVFTHGSNNNTGVWCVLYKTNHNCLILLYACVCALVVFNFSEAALAETSYLVWQRNAAVSV